MLNWRHIGFIGLFLLVLANEMVCFSQETDKFREFDFWVSQYNQADSSARSMMISNGVAMARLRRDAMIELIRNDPARALALALTRPQIEDLPPEITRYTERYVNGIVSSSPFDAGRDDLAGDNRRDLIMKGEVFRGWVYGRRLKMLRFLEVPVWGIAVGNDLAVAENPFESYSEANAPKQFKDKVKSGKKIARIGGEDREFDDQKKMDETAVQIQDEESLESERQQQKWKDRPVAGQTNVVVAFDSNDLTTERRDGYDLLALKDCVLPEDKPGSPWLPAKYINVMLPAGARIKDVKVSAESVPIMNDVMPMPVQPPVSGKQDNIQVVQPDASIYGQKEIFPADAGIQLSGSQRMLGWTFVSIRLNPIRYLPAEKKLMFASNMTVTVSYKMDKAPLPVLEKQLKRGREGIQKIVVNDIEDSLVPEPVANAEREAAKGRHVQLISEKSKPVSKGGNK